MGFHLQSRESRYQLVDDTDTPVNQANQFLRALEMRGLSPHTVRSYGFDLVLFYRWLTQADLEIGSLTQTSLLDFIAFQREQKASAKSINRRLTTCTLFYRFCFNREIPRATGSLSPAPYYKGRGRDRRLGLFSMKKPSRLQVRVKEARTIVEPLEVKQVNAFIGTLRSYRDIAIVLLMLLCGLRSCEILWLRLQEANLPLREIRIRGKGNRERILPLPSEAIITIEKYLTLERPERCPTPSLFVVLKGRRRGFSMTSAGLRRLFRYHRQCSTVRKANAHRFRHTFGADMARAGVTLPVLQRLMGHHDGKTTLQYVNLSMTDISVEYQRAMKVIEKRYAQRSV